MDLNNTSTKTIEKWNFQPFEMPDIWYNEEEIYNLMQSFKRPRYIDPISYDFKVNFWTNLLLKYAIHHHVLIINEAEMKLAFKREFKSHGLTLQPQCTSTVLKNMAIEGKLSEASNYEGGSLMGKLVSGFGWILTAPLGWSYRKISSVFYSDLPSETDGPSGNLVLVDVVSDCLSEFMRWIVDYNDLHLSPHLDIISLSDLNVLLERYFPHKSSRQLALQLLIKRRQIEIISVPPPADMKLTNATSQSIQVVKFSRCPDTGLTKFGLDKQTIDQINGLVHMRALSNKLEADEKIIEAKINLLKSNVRTSLRDGRQDDAKSYLKRGKMLEKVLERKRMQLANIEAMMLQIETSSDNIQVVDAFKNAAAALKARSMDVDSVHDTMAEIGDVMADQEEIDASLRALGDSLAGTSDMNDLESELSRLLSPSGASDKQTLPYMPDVPTNPISPRRVASYDEKFEANQI